MNIKPYLNHSLTTSDPYDIWNTDIGQLIKKIYYKSKIIGIFPAASLTFFDFYINNKLRLGYHSRQYPIVHAYRVLISLELYKRSGDKSYIPLAESSLEWLSNNYSKNYSGYCWGINMPWVSKMATYNENTPHVTHTPYVLEAFIKFQHEMNTKRFDRLIDSVLNFLDKDLIKMVDNANVLALSYSPKPETRIVVNANSYAMFCYALLYNRDPIKNAHLKNKIIRLYQFILNNQNQDGSWFYFADKEKGNFIDCFHSCFILKNIFKVNKIIPLPDSERVIANGYRYLKDCFWDDARKLFKRFSVTDRLSLIKFDLYDNAEMLNLAILLKDDELIDKLSGSIENNFVANNNIYSHIIFPNRKTDRNTLRWAVFPYLFAYCKIPSKSKIL